MTKMIDYKVDYRHYRRYYRNLLELYKRPPVRDFTFLILSLLTAAFFGLFAIKPSVKTIGELIKETKDKRMASQKLEQKINALSIAQREYALIQSDLATIYNVLPKKSDFSKLAKKIEYLAEKNNTLILGFRIEKANLFGQEEKELGPLNFTLDIVGEYSDLRNLVADLENLDRVVIVESFSFSKKKKGREEETGPSLSLTVSAKGHYLP